MSLLEYSVLQEEQYCQKEFSGWKLSMGEWKEPGAETISVEERTKDNWWNLVLQEEGAETEGTIKGTGLRKRSRKEMRMDMHIGLQLAKRELQWVQFYCSVFGREQDHVCSIREWERSLMREIKDLEQLLWITDKGDDEAEKQSLEFCTTERDFGAHVAEACSSPCFLLSSSTLQKLHFIYTVKEGGRTGEEFWSQNRAEDHVLQMFRGGMKDKCFHISNLSTFNCLKKNPQCHLWFVSPHEE